MSKRKRVKRQRRQKERRKACQRRKHQQQRGKRAPLFEQGKSMCYTVNPAVLERLLGGLV